MRMVFAIGGAYAPAADDALIAFNVRDVGHHLVLVGLYSRFGWFHPGPLLFYLLAVPYHVLGSRAVGMQVGALMINAASIVGCLAVARRRGGTPAMVCTALVLALLTRSLGADVLRDPWTPYVAVLPLCLLVLLSWSLTDGDSICLPWAVVVASFVVQTHVGYAPVTLAVLVWGTVVLVVGSVRRRRREHASVTWRPFLLAAAVGLVAWLPPLYDEVFTSDHNLSRLVRYFEHASRTAGWRTAWRIMSVQLGAKPEWLFGARPPVLGGLAPVSVGSAVPWTLVLGAGALAVGLVLRHHALTRLVWTLAVATVSGTYAIGAIRGGTFVYLVRWAWVVGALWGLAVVWAAWLVLSTAATRAVAVRAALVVFAGLTVLAGVEALQAVTIAGPQASEQSATRSVARQVVAHLPRGSGPVGFVRRTGGQDESGIAFQLGCHGVPVDFADGLAPVLPAHRAHRTRHRALLTVVDRPGAGSQPVTDHQEAIARWSPAAVRAFAEPGILVLLDASSSSP